LALHGISKGIPIVCKESACDITGNSNLESTPQFDKKFLESLELKSPSDQKIIDVLKGLKFISDQGAPTERYYAFLDQTQAPGILADAFRDAYADLFQANINAHDTPRPTLGLGH
jgi:hypothetical protein